EGLSVRRRSRRNCHLLALKINESGAYDPEAARALLEQAGWTPGDDGIMQKDGERFAVDLVTYPDRPELPLTATVLQQLFHEIGVEIRIVSSNSSEIPARHAAGTLQMGLMARNFALVPDPTGTLLQDYAPGGDWGAMGWDNPEAAQLIRRMASEGATPGDRARIAAIFRQELPVIPIAWYQQTAAISDRVEGITLDPYERGFGLARAGFVE
uniref:ABC transporter substrate-binding protein n=1 Tax=Paracoccus sp. PARArs4 TaxID=2853442 RepID=UPI0024A766E0